MREVTPEVGEWYRLAGETGEVLYFDADNGEIEIQYESGSVDLLDIEDWDAENEAGNLEHLSNYI